MKTGKIEDSFFHLTSLQIGDLQSYRSSLSLFLAPESDKFFILVDNRPWLTDLASRAAHLWQLMVTKSRLSPFANTRARREGKDCGNRPDLKDTSPKNNNEHKKVRKWFSAINAATLSQQKALLPVKKLRNSMLLNNELRRTLYGFIVFEVTWTNVRGMNYLNELQTDTSMAVEATFMKKWEFDSIEQASSCMSSWFSGTDYERLLLREYLDSIIGDVFYDAQEDLRKDTSGDNGYISSDEEYVGDKCNIGLSSDFKVYPVDVDDANLPHTPPPPTGPYKRRKITRSSSSGSEVSAFAEETSSEIFSSPKIFDTHVHSEIFSSPRNSDSHISTTTKEETIVEPTHYRDVLILFRFNDHDLPFKLREIIMSDLRLLTLLESGLPSWVIFLQSYPLFCHLYRPWMCPLVRALYVLISVVTVIIGFYDLYKNVPVLKATASRLCGPLFDWVETWEMVSRIKYLGTMLFLHNFEKAVIWFVMVSRAIRSFASVFAQPMAGPFVELLDFLLPLWNICLEAVESFYSVVWVATESSCNLVVDIVQILFSPMWFILSFIWSVTSLIICPVFWALWGVLYTPIRLILLLAQLVAFVFSSAYELLGDIWLSVSSISHIVSASEATVSTYEISIWRSLWNDLFSQVFRAVRSIVNGFVAFCVACNRHRLSIYNHILEFLRRLSFLAHRSHPPDSVHCRRTSGVINRVESAKKLHVR